MNNRRKLIIALGAGTIAWRGSNAQKPANFSRVGYLSLGASPLVGLAWIRKNLRDLGWIRRPDLSRTCDTITAAGARGACGDGSDASRMIAGVAARAVRVIQKMIPARKSAYFAKRMDKLTLGRFLAEVRLRTRNMLPPEMDPIGLILNRVRLSPNTLESRALRKATLAVIAREGDMAESDLWALGKDTLVLVDAFAEFRGMGRYHQQDLDNAAAKLWNPMYELSR